MSQADVSDMMEPIQAVLEAAQSVVEKMQDGERKQIKDLAEDVGGLLNRNPKEIFGFVNHFAHNTKIAYVTRGKKGGLVKGTRPAKVVKVKAPSSDTQ